MAGIMTPIGFLYFPAFFKPKVNKQAPAQGPRFSGVLLLDNAGVTSAAYGTLRQGVYDAIVSKFGAAKAQDANFVRGLRLPFRPASEKTYDGFKDGEIFLSAWTPEDQKPGVVDLGGNHIHDDKAVFGGQLARFTVRPFAYDTSGNRGVGLILEHVQIVKADMPRRDGGVAADEAFANADNSQLAALGINPNAPTSPTTAYQAPGAPPAGGLPF